MFINKKIATSFTSLIFVVISITGVLMFFHLFDNYTKALHELIGLFFVVFALLHVLYNFKSMKSYFKLKSFLISLIIVLIFSTFIVINNLNEKGGPGAIIDPLFEADIQKVFVLYSGDYKNAEEKLQQNGIVLGTSKTINEIAKNNNTDPFAILEILVK